MFVEFPIKHLHMSSKYISWQMCNIIIMVVDKNSIYSTKYLKVTIHLCAALGCRAPSHSQSMAVVGCVEKTKIQRAPSPAVFVDSSPRSRRGQDSRAEGPPTALAQIALWGSQCEVSMFSLLHAASIWPRAVSTRKRSIWLTTLVWSFWAHHHSQFTVALQYISF